MWKTRSEDADLVDQRTSTTIHLSGDLLAAVDRRAKDLRLTRNRYIVQALERSLHRDTAWSPDSWRNSTRRARIWSSTTPAGMRAAITTNRTSNRPSGPFKQENPI